MGYGKSGTGVRDGTVGCGGELGTGLLAVGCGTGVYVEAGNSGTGLFGGTDGDVS